MIQLVCCLLLEDYSWFLCVCVCAGRTHQGWWEGLRMQSLRCNTWKKKNRTFKYLSIRRKKNQKTWKLRELNVFVWGPTEENLWILLVFYAERETLAECFVLSKPEGRFGAVLVDLMSVWTLLSAWVWGVQVLVLLPCTESLSHLSPTTAATRPCLALPQAFDLTHEASLAVLCIIYQHWSIFN